MSLKRLGIACLAMTLSASACTAIVGVSDITFTDAGADGATSDGEGVGPDAHKDAHEDVHADTKPSAEAGDALADAQPDLDATPDVGPDASDTGPDVRPDVVPSADGSDADMGSDVRPDVIPDSPVDSGDASPPPSCAPGGPGMTNCGAGGSGNESCCASLEVTGGTFYRSYDDVSYTDMSYPATVSSFRLDKYEITVGRFRQFVNAVVGGGGLPEAGSGKHTYLNSDSGLAIGPNVEAGQMYERGWDPNDWPYGPLATTSSNWNTTLSSCSPSTWTYSSDAGMNENMPINCVAWQEAYAFCIWDGGFLPSEAEWNYAAAGGGGPTGQRVYPWSIPSTEGGVDCSHVNYKLCGDAPKNVGSSPLGNGAYGQADLAGNVWEWTLDYWDGTSPYVNPCSDCADLTASSSRTLRGSGWFDGTMIGSLESQTASIRDALSARDPNVGARCARAP